MRAVDQGAFSGIGCAKFAFGFHGLEGAVVGVPGVAFAQSECFEFGQRGAAFLAQLFCATFEIGKVLPTLARQTENLQ